MKTTLLVIAALALGFVGGDRLRNASGSQEIKNAWDESYRTRLASLQFDEAACLERRHSYAQGYQLCSEASELLRVEISECRAAVAAGLVGVNAVPVKRARNQR
jgi:hypothetical protein